MLVKYLEVVFFLFVFGFLLFIDQPKALESKDGEKQRQLPNRAYARGLTGGTMPRSIGKELKRRGFTSWPKGYPNKPMTHAPCE